MTVKIAIANQKGGVGKTTTTINIAGTAAMTTDMKVLICDCDPQSNIALYTKLEKRPAFEFIFSKDQTTESMNRRLQFLPGFKSVSLLTCHKDAIAKVNTLIAKYEEANEAGNYLRERMSRLAGFFEQFDMIVFDLPPSHGALSSNIYAMTDYVLGPVEADNGALDGIVQLVEEIDRYATKGRSKVLGLVQTKYRIDASNKPTNARIFEKLIEEKCQELRIDLIGRIRLDEAVKEANSGLDGAFPVLFQYDAKSRAAQDYLSLTYTVLKRLGLESHIRGLVSNG